MDESVRTMEMLVGQLDKRMAFIEQNLVEIRGEIAQLRSELTSEMRTYFRWTITTMIALFAVAMPAWMWVLGTILKLR